MSIKEQQDGDLRAKIAEILEYNVGSDLSDQDHKDITNDIANLFTTELARYKQEVIAALPEKMDDGLSGGPLEIRRNKEYWNQAIDACKKAIEGVSL